MFQKVPAPLFLVFSILIAFKGSSQIKTQGTPFIKNYPSIEYKFHPKNFSTIQDERGIMYFGNAYGILEFDGVAWKIINLPNGKSGLSLLQDEKGKIFVGSASEVGFLTVDPIGNTVYSSLLNKVPNSSRDFGELRNALFSDGLKVFSSISHILIFENDTFKVLKTSEPDRRFDFAGEVNGNCYFRESGKGLLFLQNGQLKPVRNGHIFASDIIYSILPYNKGELLIISSKGLSIYNGDTFTPLGCPLNDIIKKNPVTKGISLRNNFYAISTHTKGIIIFDEKGYPVQFLSKKNGLPTDEVYSIFLDAEDNVWAATDNGISYVQTSSSFTSINEDVNIPGMGYASFIHNNKLYLGTSQGLFVKGWDDFRNPLHQNSGFELVRNTEGQICYINEVGGELLCGDKRGLYAIRNGEAIRLSPHNFTGGWVFRSFKEGKYLVLGTFEGLEIYEKKGGFWTYKNKVNGFYESSRTLEIDHEDNIWICHGNNGLYKLRLDDNLENAIEVKNISVANGFIPDYFNDIIVIENETLFAGDYNLYKYNSRTDKLEIHPLSQLIGEEVLISRIVQLKNGDIWVVNKDVIEVLSKGKNGDYKKDKTVLRKLKGQLIGSFEFFWMFNDENYFIGTQEGFVHFDPTIADPDKSFNVVIRKVESINENDSLLFAGTIINPEKTFTRTPASSESIKIPYSKNALRITYSALFYEDQEKNQYQYYLEKKGSDHRYKWTNWSLATYKEYTNLPEGEYVFHLRAKNIYDTISEETNYSFTILPPWYRTKAAYIAYGLFSILVLVLIVKLVRLKISKEKKRIEKEKEQELLLMEKQFTEEALKAEKEIILLQNEKLEAEVRYKKEELANLATNLSQKTEFLTQLKKDLVSITKETNLNGNSPSIEELIKTIDKGIEFDDTWNHFQSNFDLVHHNFLFKIREKYPALKPTDLLLCAYIKMNKTNKEISSLLNVSISAVEKRRFRLREKLKLRDDTLLTDFLMQI